MNQKFSDGTIVWLKTGGPAMTINVFHNPTQRYRCVWFVDTDLNHGEFYNDALTDINPSDS
jgi:uncharacterized protein YodC (DUF2158 family)